MRWPGSDYTHCDSKAVLVTLPTLYLTRVSSCAQKNWPPRGSNSGRRHWNECGEPFYLDKLPFTHIRLQHKNNSTEHCVSTYAWNCADLAPLWGQSQQQIKSWNSWFIAISDRFPFWTKRYMTIKLTFSKTLVFLNFYRLLLILS